MASSSNSTESNSNSGVERNEYVCITVAYNGCWSMDKGYRNFQMKYILVDRSIGFEDLKLKISKFLSCNTEDIDIYFETDITHCKGMQLLSDEDFSTCLHLLTSDNLKFKNKMFLVDLGGNSSSNPSDVQSSTIVPEVMNPKSVFDNSDTAVSKKRTVNEKVVSIVNAKKVRSSETTDVSFIQHAEQDIYEGKIFDNKIALKNAVATLAISRKFQFRLIRSNKKVYHVSCAVGVCQWNMKSNSIGSSEIFKVNNYNPKHTCPAESRSSDQRHATSEVIGSYYSDMVQNPKLHITPGLILSEMRDQIGVKPSYQKAWRALNKAHDSAYGTPESSFQSLPSYLHMLKQSNPGSITDIKKDQMNRFLYTFVAYGSSIEGFKHCRPVIQVDATFLTGKYRGVLMEAVSKDGNNQIFPIAFAVADSENNESWFYFFTQLNKAIGSRDGLTVLSDRHASIKRAILLVYPNCYHGLCYLHLKRNLLSKFKKADAVQIFVNAVGAYRKDEYDKLMEQIQKVDKKMYKYLTEDVQPSQWARALYPQKRYNMDSTNNAESFNNVLKVAKAKPLTGLLDFIQETLQRWFSERRSIADGTFTCISSWANKVLMSKQEHAFKMKVEPIDAEIFKVFSNSKKFVVNLSDKTCTCLEFDMEELPCHHAIAAIDFRHLSLNSYCGNWYSNESLKKTYKGRIYPIESKDVCDIPDEIKEEIVEPPAIELKKGRRQVRRFLSIGEYTGPRYKCSRCKKAGHRVTNCLQPI